VRVHGGRVGVDQPQHRSGQERPENRLETQSLGQREKCDEQQRGEPDPDLRGGVHQLGEHPLGAGAAPGPHQRHRQQHRDQRQASQQQQPRGQAGGLLGEQQRQQDHRAEVGDRRRGDDLLAGGAA